MPLTEGDLVAISALNQLAMTGTGSAVVRDIVTVVEPLNSTDPILRAPYQHQLIEFIGGGEFAITRNFQNPSQRVIIELEIYFGKRAPVMVAPDLSALKLTLNGFDAAVILCPPDDATDAAPANFMGLQTSTTGALTYKAGGRRPFVDGSGLITIPLTILAVSSSPLITTETFRALSVFLQRVNASQTVYYPAITGTIKFNPLVSARDTAAAS